MKEEDIRELLRELGNEPVPLESLVRLRARVAERARPRSWRRWRVAAMLLLPACLGILALLIHPPGAGVPPPNIPVAMRPPAPRAEPPPRPEVTRAPKRQVRHRVAPPRRVEHTGAAALIRIETPDPDVVILLVGE